MEKIVKVVNLKNHSEKYVSLEHLLEFCEEQEILISRVPDIDALSAFSAIRIDEFVFEQLNVY